MILSTEQELAFCKYKMGQNVFLTGPGGTGKSALIKHIYEDAKRMRKRIQVCALTGCAAIMLNCDAKTVHSWAGIGLGNKSIEDIIFTITNNNYKKRMWTTIDVLIIDEVSMLSLKLFNLLNEIAKIVRKRPWQPFGGIQDIFSGDFFQLPPVGSKEEPETQQFCFESEKWDETFSQNQIQLSRIYRQTDEEYASILNEIRIGRLSRKAIDRLESRVTEPQTDTKHLSVVKLYPIRNKVEQINRYEMQKLEGEVEIYNLEVKDEVIGLSPEQRMTRQRMNEQSVEIEVNSFVNSLLCEKQLGLKIGSHVMCIVNVVDDDKIVLCNGSQGIVTSFESGIEDENEEAKMEPNKEVKKEAKKRKLYPRVLFNNGVNRLMRPQSWECERVPGIKVLQVPLILSWALTIHKAQGASLDCAQIDVGSSIFECGQSYVALSRVRTLEGLYLTSLDVNKIKINRKVKEYYDGIQEK